ncbi:MAG: hypothetical protein JWP18_2018 [Solirubrobacterales bacterium]|jgi:HD-GYP domain-containing protein (c-di-GMP phosphodiesterase class II)|nr:hypothetical protein [Solirubrobacterales bacterium]
MTHDRPSRRARSTADAPDELRACAEKQFDADVVTAACAVLEGGHRAGAQLVGVGVAPS